MVTHDEIESEMVALDILIRHYSTERVHAWKHIPYWALKATNPDEKQLEIIQGFEKEFLLEERGPGTEYAGLIRRIRAFKFGVWAVEASAQDNRYTTFVDCASGRFIQASRFVYENVLVDTSPLQILRIGRKIKEIDPLDVLKQYKHRAVKPLSESIEQWQEGAIKEHNLDPYGFKREP